MRNRPHLAGPPRRANRVLAEVEAARDEIVAFTADMIRIPTVNPPGESYRDCAELIGGRLGEAGLDVRYVEAEGLAEHTAAHPRVNVIGRGIGEGARRRIHLNGHFDVVPPGEGWSVDPFGGVVSDGRIHGRGASDMKSGRDHPGPLRGPIACAWDTGGIYWFDVGGQAGETVQSPCVADRCTATFDRRFIPRGVLPTKCAGK